MPRLIGIGEAMGELRPDASGNLRLDVSGDVLNTLAYVRAFGGVAWDIGFVSATGTDPVSQKLRERCVGLGIEMLCAEDAARPLGLYLISTDASGERSFTYWRSASPARQLVHAMDGQARSAVLAADWLLLTGITLAILDDPQREALSGLLSASRAHGARVVFDPNFRARLWSDVATARRWSAHFCELSDVVLPGLEDESALAGVSTAHEVLQLPEMAAAAEVVVKAGRAGVLARVGGTIIAAPFVAPRQVLDTTAAGDGFNAAWLVSRERGLRAEECAAFAASAAAAIASQPGAIVPFDTLPSLPSPQESTL